VPEPLATVVARNAKALRGSANLDDVAKAARRQGLNWGTARVSDLEHGKVSPTLPTLIALALALGEIRGEPLTLGDLVRSDESVSLSDDLTLTGDELQGFLSGGKISLTANPVELAQGGPAALTDLREGWPERLIIDVTPGQLRRIRHDYGEPEERLARDVDLDRMRLIAEMAALWDQSFSKERDRRAGPGANAQKKGRVARQLKSELRSVLDGDNQ
jgi:hypothetical protein